MPSFLRNRKILLSLLLVGVTYFTLALVSTVTVHESIDELGFDFWSTRLSKDFVAPTRALKLDPALDKQIGHIGFIPSGHFVYNKLLSEIAAGVPYHVTPMIHFVSLYVHAFFKVLFGAKALHFVHVFLLLCSVLFVVFRVRSANARQREGGNTLAWLLVLSPAFLANATYATSEAVGLFGISLFLYCLTCKPATAQSTALVTIGLIISGTLTCFFKPIGIVLLPWCYVLIATKADVPRTIRAVIFACFVLAGLLVTGIAEQIYSNPLFGGYRLPINQFLAGTPFGTAAEEPLSNASYGSLALLVFYPIFTPLAFKVFVDLRTEWRKSRRFDLSTLKSPFAERFIHLYPLFFYFFFFTFYSHSDQYFVLDNPTLRYYLIPIICLVWYVVRFNLDLGLERWFRPIIATSVVLAVAAPKGIPARLAYRAYSAILKDELKHVLPKQALLFGACKYDRLFVNDGMPVYSFLSDRLNARIAADQMRVAAPVLGTIDQVVSSVYRQGFVPVLIFPDYVTLDSNVVENPYAAMQYEQIAHIDMVKKLGVLGRFIPTMQRTITVARVVQR